MSIGKATYILILKSRSDQNNFSIISGDSNACVLFYVPQYQATGSKFIGLSFPNQLFTNSVCLVSKHHKQVPTKPIICGPVKYFHLFKQLFRILKITKRVNGSKLLTNSSIKAKNIQNSDLLSSVLTTIISCPFLISFLLMTIFKFSKVPYILDLSYHPTYILKR